MEGIYMEKLQIWLKNNSKLMSIIFLGCVGLFFLIFIAGGLANSGTFDATSILTILIIVGLVVASCLLIAFEKKLATKIVSYALAVILLFNFLTSSVSLFNFGMMPAILFTGILGFLLVLSLVCLLVYAILLTVGKTTLTDKMISVLFLVAVIAGGVYLLIGFICMIVSLGSAIGQAWFLLFFPLMLGVAAPALYFVVVFLNSSKVVVEEIKEDKQLEKVVEEVMEKPVEEAKEDEASHTEEDDTPVQE